MLCDILALFFLLEALLTYGDKKWCGHKYFAQFEMKCLISKQHFYAWLTWVYSIKA